MLNNLWQRWKRFARIIGDFIGRIILTLFYFTLFLPFGLGMRFFGDPLAIRLEYSARWIERATSDLSIDDARMQS